jgi:hypothetical protein
LTKESRGDDILLKDADIRESEEQISKDIDLLMEQDFIKEFQPIHQQAKLVQEQLECESHIFCRLKQKLKSHKVQEVK